MYKLSKNDYTILEALLKCNDVQAKRLMSGYLNKIYDKIWEKENYIICKGDIPIALCAHMDTVSDTSSKEKVLFYDSCKNIAVSIDDFPVGFDDKCGLFSIIKILATGRRPHVILTRGEEMGGVGAMEVVKDFETPPFDLRYMIEIDRRGHKDCVFYDCDNEDFEKYVNRFGFETAYGSFTDICDYMEQWEIAGVNLSCGYENEHTSNECLYIPSMFQTIEKIKVMLDEEEIPAFKFIPSKHMYRIPIRYGNYDYPIEEDYEEYDYYRYDDEYYERAYQEYMKNNPDPNRESYVCDICGHIIMPEEAYQLCTDDNTIRYTCIDCIANSQKVGWCDKCGDAFNKTGLKKMKIELCPCCRKG